MKRIVVFLLLLMLMAGCRQKIEYDQPTGEPCDMSGYEIETDTFYSMTLEEFYRGCDEEKTMVVLLSHITCPWCQCLVPVVDEVALERKWGIYYIDADVEFLNDQRILEMCGRIEGKTAVDDEGNPCLYLPSILFVQKGQIMDIHVGTVTGHDATATGLSEKQRKRLVYLLEKEFDALLGD